MCEAGTMLLLTLVVGMANGKMSAMDAGGSFVGVSG